MYAVNLTFNWLLLQRINFNLVKEDDNAIILVDKILINLNSQAPPGDGEGWDSPSKANSVRLGWAKLLIAVIIPVFLVILFRS